MARGDIWSVDLPVPQGSPGHEQFGLRPAVVVQTELKDTALPTTVVIPTTSNQKAGRFPFTILIPPTSKNGLSTASILLIFQIRAIDKGRLNRRIGKLESEHIEKMENEIRALLGL
ncbi:MAG: type II toxin-antitoxin system PemK/MazF family toxin [Candidatus Aminicenantes bacterium]|nr:type II toxin-antitoxin system PemK/MazF family toxin [Candidatus Aminicenantes bacterium]